MRTWAKKTPLKGALSSVFGYFVATATLTLPNYLSGRRRVFMGKCPAWVGNKVPKMK